MISSRLLVDFGWPSWSSPTGQDGVLGGSSHLPPQVLLVKRKGQPAPRWMAIGGGGGEEQRGAGRQVGR